MAAHQAPPSLGFSRQEHYSGLPFPSPMHESEKWKSPSRVPLLVTPWTAAHQAPPSMGFSKQEYWSGVPLPSPNHRLSGLKEIKQVAVSLSNLDIPSVPSLNDLMSLSPFHPKTTEKYPFCWVQIYLCSFLTIKQTWNAYHAPDTVLGAGVIAVSSQTK